MSLIEDIELFLTAHSLYTTAVSPTTAHPALSFLSKHSLSSVFDLLLEGGPDSAACILALSHLLVLPAAIATLTRPEDGALMLSALGSPLPSIRALPLSLLRALASGAAPWPAGFPRPALLEAEARPVGLLVQALGDAEPRLGEAAGATLTLLAASPAQGELAALAHHLRAFLASAEDVALVRALGVVASLCAAGEAACAALAAPLTTLLACALDASDPLLQANVLELLGPLGGSQLALATLLASPLLPALLTWAGLAAPRAQPPLSLVDASDLLQQQALLAPAALTALAEVHATACRRAPGSAEVAQLRAALLPGLLALLAAVCEGESSSSCDVPCVLHALGLLLQADSAALQALLEEGSSEAGSGSGSASGSGGRRRCTLRCVLELAEASNSEHRAACLAVLAKALHAGCPPAPVQPAQQLLALLAWLGRACRGEAHFASLQQGAGAGTGTGAAGAAAWECGVGVLAGALSRRVPPGDPSLTQDPAHAARWAAFDALVGLVRLPGPEGLCAVFSPALRLGQALLEEGASGREGSAAGREWVARVLRGALTNECVGSVGGGELARSLQAAVGRLGQAATVLPAVLVAQGEYM